MNIKNINKLFSESRFQQALMDYESYALSNFHMSKNAIFNARFAKHKLNQQLINLSTSAKKSDTNLENTLLTDYLEFPRLWGFEGNEAFSQRYCWYKFDFIVMGKAAEPISIIRIPVSWIDNIEVYINSDFELNQPISLVSMCQTDGGFEASYQGCLQLGDYSLAFMIQKIDTAQIFGQLMFEFSKYLKVDPNQTLSMLNTATNLISIFGVNPEITYFERYFKNKSALNASESTYYEALISNVLNHVEARFGRQVQPSVFIEHDDNVKVVAYREELGDGINYHIECVKFIGNIQIIHGWIIDPKQQIKSIKIHDPIAGLTHEIFDKLLRFKRIDVVEAFNLEVNANTLPNGFVVVIKNQDLVLTTGLKEVSLKFITKNAKVFTEKALSSHLPLDTNGLKHVMGVFPDPEINRERCEGFFYPLFTTFCEMAPKIEEVFDVVYDYAKTKVAPVLSIIIPLYGDIRFELTQIPVLAALGAPDFELIFAVDDPRILDHVKTNVERLANLYSVSVRVVAPDRNLGFSGINNFAVERAQGEFLLFLNSDCFVTEPLALLKAIKWLRNAKNGAVGFRLLFADKAIQHDGMSVSKWKNSPDFYLNDHPNAGIPENLLDNKADCYQSTMLTAACLMVSKHTFNGIGGFNCAYLRGDFEDSDLCLKIIAKGQRLGIIRNNTIYHLERQTIASQNADLRQKITLINSYIYSRRWKSMLAKKLPLLTVLE